MEQFYYTHNAVNLELFDRLCAFHLYKRHGIDTACSVYPEHREFILAHIHQTLEEVRRECYKSLERNPDHS
ncbi:MAG TPA: hypothetical protein VGE66_03000 [Chitinophagaceae bacterium]